MTHILVVEDDYLLAQLFSRMLNHAGYTTTHLNLCQQALNHICDGDTAVPAAIILDMRLPDGDGFDVINHLRQLPRWSHTPIIAMSATRYFEIELAKVSVHYFLYKPVVYKMLVNTVNQVLARPSAQAISMRV